MSNQQSEVDLARTEALRGNVDIALPVLARHAEAGDDSAAASAAELSAYLWRWGDAILHTPLVLLPTRWPSTPGTSVTNLYIC
jgi:hypothetical protein